MSYARVFSILLLIGLLTGGRAAAQAPEARFAVAAQISALRLADVDATNAGIGGRLSFDLAPWLAMEGDLVYFPRERFESPAFSDLTPDLRLAYSRERVGVFAGPRMGVRGGRLGLFGRIQPGFTRLTHRSVECRGDDCARVLLLIAPPQYRTEFAVQVGGAVEFYPSRRTIARIDLGSTLVRHRSLAPPCDDCTSRNLFSSVGIGFRF